MWCKNCNRETEDERCELCGSVTEQDIPYEVFWCDECKVPIIKAANSIDKNICTLCNGNTTYLCADLRPVFPEERLLLEIIGAKPFAYHDKAIWASNNRYYIDGKVKLITTSFYKKNSPKVIRELLDQYSVQNDYLYFNQSIERFIKANQDRLNYLKDEAFAFIQSAAEKYPHESIVLSFSGGKDSTVTADLAARALSDPSLVHIFGDTTLEFPLTMEYAQRFRKNNPKAIFKVAKNKEQNFYKVCEDIGPPARMLRWCCSMFKTGPITRVLNSMYRDRDILTFYGIRKCESVSRSKYNRIEDNAEAVKIQKQKVASPIFYWKDIDIWLYILGEQIDFNDAYRLGYDRVGCWCCPNNNERAQFLSQIYMPEQAERWRNFLVDFAKRIGKPDAEVYVDTGKWKARQGGNGVVAAEDVKIKFTNCTAEENAKIYKLNKPVDDSFIQLFNPFGRIAPELGRKLINETIVIDIKTNVPILSIQPFSQDGYDFAVKVKTLNVAKHDDLQRMVGYQVRKFNACRKCLKCESLCKFGAISVYGDTYLINEQKCKRCKMCVTAKYLDGGCLMDKYLKTKD
ncbi:phosphoadenosine phosphosulfate reductase family protein [Pseudobacteroides cellulosolvens]|uniref:Phosphoadenosine phosphosulfate reductase n=1 Tax=Pseudobacteroides cellulosolvens ATCC 35603 = DSM 2933 TaxID=398512 RepID=A0A0L6JPX9_9FIRM|nr:phosphoadenosine phosphosulfate reductase family protein [Pseudobacteroides cellulosolvens]KNY27735.1 phosphoadenosine phosphosulfate reductase [Pseudobacteroides cellulosolvens ATCC 35603 = DSM 2933]